MPCDWLSLCSKILWSRVSNVVERLSMIGATVEAPSSASRTLVCTSRWTVLWYFLYEDWFSLSSWLEVRWWPNLLATILSSSFDKKCFPKFILTSRMELCERRITERYLITAILMLVNTICWSAGGWLQFWMWRSLKTVLHDLMRTCAYSQAVSWSVWTVVSGHCHIVQTAQRNKTVCWVCHPKNCLIQLMMDLKPCLVSLPLPPPPLMLGIFKLFCFPKVRGWSVISLEQSGACLSLSAGRFFLWAETNSSDLLMSLGKFSTSPHISPSPHLWLSHNASVTFHLVTRGYLSTGEFHRCFGVCLIFLPIFHTSVEWSHNPPVIGGAS